MKLSIKEICYFLFVRLPNIIIGKYIKKKFSICSLGERFE